MSAFAGFVSFAPSAVPPGTEARLCGGLEGKGLAPPAVCRADNAVFVFRQRTVAPEDRHERQPAVGPDSGVVSMFDGRLDNRAELLAALGAGSPHRAPLPDGDLVRAAYERWGEDAVPRLLGDFAWAVWNPRDRRLMLARDHGQTRALFYCRGEGFVAFATGYRPLLALPQVPKAVDELAAADLLLTSTGPGGRSFYKAISWVGAAGRVVVTPRGVRRDRTWEPAPRPTLRLPRDEDYIHAARAVFDEAVACRLRVAGPVVSSASGGLDSSAVAATAARMMAPAAVHGLCVVPAAGAPLRVAGAYYADERPFVGALAARHPNLRLECLESGALAPFELDPAPLFLQAGMPFRGSADLGWFLRMYDRTAELGATTLLVGDWGNLTFSASGFDRLSALRRAGAWLALARELAALCRTLPARSWRPLARYQSLAVLSPRLLGELRRMRHGGTPLSRRSFPINPEFVRRAGLEGRYARYGVGAVDFLDADGGLAFVRNTVLCSRMQVEARAALRALTGVTASDPFADRRVVDFCLSLPADQFLRQGEPRRLARRAFADRLPPEIAGNHRRGAQHTDWHQRLTPHRPLFAKELDRLEGSALASGILDLPHMRRILAGWPDDPLADGSNGALYRVTLLRALHLGQFLRWSEGADR